MGRPRTIPPCRLLMYSDYNKTDFVGDLQMLARSYKRSIRAHGGMWQASFEIIGLPFEELLRMYRTWLGYHFVELYGSTPTWEGMVYELDILYRGTQRRRSLDTMYNALKGVWLGNEQLRNTSFETSGTGGGGDVFFNWIEELSDGAIARASATQYSGLYCCKLTAGSAKNTRLTQQTGVEGYEKLDISFYTRGDGSFAGRWGVYDVDNTKYIIAVKSTGVSGAAWTKVEENVPIPTGCNELRVEIWCPASDGAHAFFDYIHLQGYETIKETEWNINEGSIGRFGRREEILYMDGYLPSTAEQQLRTHLKEFAWPIGRVLSFGRDAEPRLQLRMCGYSHTMNWKYVTTQDSLVVPVSTYIDGIVSDDCPYITRRIIETNTGVQQTRLTRQPMRAWDLINELTLLGDDEYNRWVAFVDIDRIFRYQKLDLEPMYYQRHGRYYTRTGLQVAVNPWLMRPAVVRDTNWPVTRTQPGCIFEDPRDYWMHSIEIDWMGRIRPQALYYTESSILSTQLESARE